MSTKKVFIIINDSVRNNAINYIKNISEGFSVEIKEKTRSNRQNALFHSICGELAKSGFKFAGKERSLESWKVILISGHSKATEGDGEVVAGIEGELIALRESSAKMSVKRMVSLVEYAQAYCAMSGIKLRDVTYSDYDGVLR